MSEPLTNEEPLEENFEPEDREIDGEEDLSRGFTSSTPFEDVDASCLVICCSDHRFRPHTIEFLSRLGYNHPHVISLPGGVAIVHSLAAAIGFLSKAATRLIDKAVELTGVREIVCIAHEDCGGYKAGRIKLVGKVSRRLAGASVQDIQREHLEKAARTIELSTRVNVRTFYADVVGEGDNQRVKFDEVQRHRRRAT